jgi:hypothetical protein
MAWARAGEERVRRARRKNIGDILKVIHALLRNYSDAGNCAEGPSSGLSATFSHSLRSRAKAPVIMAFSRGTK